MLLMEMPEVISNLSQLQIEIERFDISNLYDRYMQTCLSITEWKFASNGDAFDYLPYSNEMDGNPPPKLIKRKYKNMDEARLLGKYCSGFVNDDHIITVFPGHLPEAILASFFYRADSGDIEEQHFDIKFLNQPEKRKPQLRALSRWFNIYDNDKIQIGAGTNGGAFSVLLYKYTVDGRPVSVRVFSKGWQGEGVYFFHYDEKGEMYKITHGAGHLHSNDVIYCPHESDSVIYISKNA